MGGDAAPGGKQVNALRSVLAIGAGFFATSILSLTGDYALRRLMPGSFAADGGVQGSNVFAITLLYTALFGVIGGYLAARIAIQRPLLHAAILGGVMLVLSALSAAFLWSTAPPWYHLATLAMVLPAALIGGKIRELQVEQP
jgi:CBS domain containing-hemolysin-like protein